MASARWPSRRMAAPFSAAAMTQRLEFGRQPPTKNWRIGSRSRRRWSALTFSFLFPRAPRDSRGGYDLQSALVVLYRFCRDCGPFSGLRFKPSACLIVRDDGLPIPYTLRPYDASIPPPVLGPVR